MGFTRHAKDIILTKVFTEGGIFENENFYIGLWCSSIVDSFGEPIENGEVTAASYARVAIPNDGTSFSEVYEKDIRNLNEITFEEAIEDWGIITHVGVFDSDKPEDDDDESNLLFYCELETSREVVSGDVVKFPPAALRFGIE